MGTGCVNERTCIINFLRTLRFWQPGIYGIKEDLKVCYKVKFTYSLTGSEPDGKYVYQSIFNSFNWIQIYPADNSYLKLRLFLFKLRAVIIIVLTFLDGTCKLVWIFTDFVASFLFYLVTVRVWLIFFTLFTKGDYDIGCEPRQSENEQRHGKPYIRDYYRKNYWAYWSWNWERLPPFCQRSGSVVWL